MQGYSPVSLSIEQLIACQNIALRLPPWRQSSGLRSGNRLSRIRGRGMEFDEVRHYQHGDDIRNIDWRVTARTGKTHTKLFREDREQPLMLLVDLSSSMLFGSQHRLKSVLACELGAALGWLGRRNNERVGLVIALDEQCLIEKAVNTNNGYLQLLQRLLTVHNEQVRRYQNGEIKAENTGQQQALEQLAMLVKTGYQVHLLSDFYQLGEHSKTVLQRLSAHNQCFAWQVVDPLEFYLPMGSEQLLVSRHQQQASLPLGNSAFRQQYQTRALARQNAIDGLLTDAGIIFEQFSTHQQWNDYVGKR